MAPLLPERPRHPSWLLLRIARSGGLTLNGNCLFHGFVQAPNGPITINGGARLYGAVECDRLTVNGNGQLLARPFEAVDDGDSDGDGLDDQWELDNFGSLGVDPGADPDGDGFTNLQEFQNGTNPNDFFNGAAPVVVIISGNLQVVAESGTSADPLVVEVRKPDGMIWPDAPLRFEVAAGDGLLLADPLAPEDSGEPARDLRTDSQGRASVYFRQAAGPHDPSRVSAVSGAADPVYFSMLQRPFGQFEPLEVEEDSTPVSINLWAAVEDADGPDSALVFEVVENSNPGLLSPEIQAASGQLTLAFTPDANGSGQLIIRAEDADGLAVELSLQVTVAPVNDAPVVQGLSFELLEDSQVNITLLASDPDQDSLDYTVAGGPRHGTLSGVAPNLVYTPDPGFYGVDSFQYKASDASLESAEATVSLAVIKVNNAPMALPAQVSLEEDGMLIINLSGIDPDGDPLTYEIVSGPQHGELAGSGSQVVYAPEAGYKGTDSFQFRASDGTAFSGIATVSIVIYPRNNRPVAQSQSVATLEDTSLAITLAGVDPDGNALSYSLGRAPQHGTLSGTPPNVIYSPAADYAGPDSFTFLVSDAFLESDPAEVSITVQPANDRPQAVKQAYETNEGQPISIELSALDPDMDPLTFSILTPPGKGTLSGSAPHLTYTPIEPVLGAAAYYTDSFVFTARDESGQASVALVEIRVLNINQPPVILSTPIREAFLGDQRPFLKGVIRDFTDAHPDMGSSLNSLIKGMVQPVLAADKKPVLSSTYNPASIHSPDSFAQWYRDVPGVNLTTVLPLYLNRTQSGTYQFNGNDFFPIDGKLFSLGLPGRNYLFTMESHARFIYRGGETFHFAGDDDVWIFIDNRLAVDLGGVHTTAGASIDLDALGLVPGQVYDIDFFFAERRPVDSNFLLTTTLEFVPDLSYAYQLAALDPDGDTLTYSLVAGPQGLTIDPQSGLISWQPGMAGTYPISVRVDDGQGGIATQTFDLMVAEQASDGSPSFTSKPIETYAASGRNPYYQYSSIARDPDGDDLALRYSVVQGPEGSAIDETTGLFTFPVDSNTPSIVPVVLMVQDPDGKFDFQRFNVEILSRPPAAAVQQDKIYLHSGASGDLVLSASVSDPDGSEPQIRWTLISQHDHYALSAIAGQRTVTVPAPQEPGIYVFQVEADDGYAVSRDCVEVFVDQAGEVDLTSKMRAWWPANGYDDDVIGGFRPQGTLSDSGHQSGFSGMNWKFDGFRLPLVYEEAVFASAVSESFSLEFWMKPSVAGDRGILSWRNDNNGVISQLRTSQSGRSIVWQLNAASSMETPAVLRIQEWNHVALVWNDPEKRALVYVNGQLASTRTFSSRPAVGGRFHVGIGSNSAFLGNLDEMALYDNTLSFHEIYSIYASRTLGKQRVLNNRAPYVDAGQDHFQASLGSLNLAGAIQDDGKPGASLRHSWTQVGGPVGGAAIDDPASLTPLVAFPQPGTYQFELAGDDAHARSRDRVRVSVGVPLTRLDMRDSIAHWWPANNVALT